jgi:hypothetical protein
MVMPKKVLAIGSSLGASAGRAEKEYNRETAKTAETPSSSKIANAVGAINLLIVPYPNDPSSDLREVGSFSATPHHV